MASLESSPFKELVGKNLRRFREALEINQAAMCKRLGVATGKYSQWETGKSLVNIHDAIRLCEKTECTLDYLYRGKVGSLPNKIASHPVFGEEAPETHNPVKSTTKRKTAA